jgi:transketolase
MTPTMREAVGRKLAVLGRSRNDLVVLDADVSSSSRSLHFAAEHPDRFFNVGVAEANLVDIAGGLATCGFRPVANAFAIFLALKAADQIRNVLCYNKLPVVLAGTYAGLSDSFDGASHQAIADLAILRGLPNLTLVVPADNAGAEAALEAALEADGPVYLRINRNEVPVLPPAPEPFALGRIRTWRRGGDVTLAADGICLAMALEAAERLARAGIRAEVLEIATLKPLDGDALAASVARTGRLVVAEEHSVIGGLAGACAEALAARVPFLMETVGIRDLFTESGPYGRLLEKYGITAAEIERRALALLAKGRAVAGQA